MASRRELLDSISCDMRLDKSFFMKIYGYELTWPGFAEDALTRLEFLGCSKAREYYNRFVNEYEKEHEQQMKNVAKWYKKQCENESKSRKAASECREKEKQQEAEKQKRRGLPREYVANQILKW